MRLVFLPVSLPPFPVVRARVFAVGNELEISDDSRSGHAEHRVVRGVVP